jgi:hypothetical protein
MCSAYLVFDFIIVNLVNLQTLKLLIIQLAPASCYVLRLRSRYCPQHFNLKNPRSVLFPSSDRSSLSQTPKQLQVLSSLHLVYYRRFQNRNYASISVSLTL